MPTPTTPTTPQQRAAAAERQRRSRARRRAEAGLPPARTYRSSASAAPATKLRLRPDAPGMRWCAACHHDLPISTFPPNYPYCRPCHAAKSRAWYNRNAERVSERRAAKRASTATIPHQSKI